MKKRRIAASAMRRVVNVNAVEFEALLRSLKVSGEAAVVVPVSNGNEIRVVAWPLQEPS